AFSGVFADRWGRRRFLVAGTLIPVPSYLVFALTTDPAWLIAASVLGGVGLANGAAGALTVSSFDALLAEKASEAQRTRVFASSQALWSLALAVGSLAAAVPTLLRTSLGVSALESYRLPYLAMAVITVAVVPFLERRLGGPRTVLLALTASGSCLALIVVAPVFTIAAALFVLRSFFTSLSWPFQQALLMTATVPEERATAVGSGFAVW